MRAPLVRARARSKLLLLLLLLLLACPPYPNRRCARAQTQLTRYPIGYRADSDSIRYRPDSELDSGPIASRARHSPPIPPPTTPTHTTHMAAPILTSMTTSSM